jgi:tetratricopeptide (TPR) repeat protein
MSYSQLLNGDHKTKLSINDEFYYLAKAQTALAEGDLNLVLDNLVKADAIVPDEIEIIASIRSIQAQLGLWKEMLPTVDLLINLQPDEVEWRINRLSGLMGCKAYEKVVQEAPPLLDVCPNHETILSYLATSYYHTNRFSRSLQAANTLIELKATKSQYLLLRGLNYRAMGDAERAKIELLKAESFDDSNVAIVNALGALHVDSYEHDIALTYFCKALALDNGTQLSPPIAFNASFSAFCLGKFDKGWQLYAYRKYLAVKGEATYPAWQGESLSGKHLVVRPEQGLGDQLRFASVIHEIATEAKLVTLECEPRLIDLYERSFPKNVELIGADVNFHGDSYVGVDCAAHIGDLSHYKRRSLDDFPEHCGFLQPDPVRVKYWTDYLSKFDGQVNVGVCWKSGNTKGIRNLYYTDMEHWLPVFLIEGINFVNLFYGDGEDELRWVKAKTGVEVHTPIGIDLKNDMDDLSALIASLDLVVGPHTACLDLAMAVKGASAWVLPFHSSSTSPYFYFGQVYFPWAPAAKPVHGDGFEETLKVLAEELAYITQDKDPKLTLAEISKVMYACYGMDE